MQRVTVMHRAGQVVAACLRRAFALLPLLALLVAVSTPAAAAPDRGPKVYLLRGFANVFSLGLDELSAKIERRGIRSEVYNHLSWSRLVDEIAREYKSGQTRPIVIIGHSIGGAAVVWLVEGLGKVGVPVALAVTLDASSMPINGGRVGTFLNLYSGTGALTAGRGFHGRLVNMEVGAKNPGVGHLSIDKADAMHDLILRHIGSAVGRGGPRRPAQPANTALPASRS